MITTHITVITNAAVVELSVGGIVATEKWLDLVGELQIRAWTVYIHAGIEIV